MFPSYKMTLADGFDLQITAGDVEALPIVEMLARVMALPPGKAEYELLVLTGRETELFSRTGNTITCRIPPPKNQDDLVTRAMQASLAIAHAVQKHGGVLVHGGLAEYEGQGIILAAPGGTGKTTASTRLPDPWRSLSDDAVLIVRDTEGNCYGHPWPTWSRFYQDGPGGVWNTCSGFPLKALYFLFQSPDDALEDLNANQVAAMLIESVEQANSVFSRNMPPAGMHDNHRAQFNLVGAVTDRLPAYRLRLGLTGDFWRLIEDSLKRQTPITIDSTDSCLEGSGHGKAFAAEKIVSSGVVFSGNSMYPTLKEPGYLAVRPYDAENPRWGDVVYFRAPKSGTMVVHRIMALRPDGLVTRGDNNSQNDPDVVPLSAVKGKVISIRDAAGNNKPVRSGAAGMLDYAFARIFRRAKALAGRMYRLFFPSHSLTGCLRLFAPNSADFKFVFFGQGFQGQLKILSSNVCVGHYSRGVWHIAYPWRLWVDPVQIELAAREVESAKEQWRRHMIANREIV